MDPLESQIEKTSQMRIQTATWLRKRSINAAMLLSGDGPTSSTSSSTSLSISASSHKASNSIAKINPQLLGNKSICGFHDLNGEDLKQNNNNITNNKNNKKIYHNINFNDNNINNNNNLQITIKINNCLNGNNFSNKSDIITNANNIDNFIISNDTDNINNNNNIYNKFVKSASLLTRPSKSTNFLSKSFDSNMTLRVSPSNVHPRKKSIYEMAVMTSATSEGTLPVELEQRARQEAEKAMKDKKIFTVIGPYPSLRASLRKRGWVEKLPSMTPKCEALDIASDHLSDEKSPELITMMSQVVRNSMPSLIFSVKVVDIGSHAKTGQLVNHFARSSNFTTKAGLCHNLKDVPWFVHCDPNTFYPRCYNLANDEEKDAFKDDFRLTACCSLLKQYLVKQSNLEVVMGGACSGSRRSSRLSSAFPSTRKQSAEVLVPMLRVVRSPNHRSPIKNEVNQGLSDEMPSENVLTKASPVNNTGMNNSLSNLDDHVHNHYHDVQKPDEINDSEIDQVKGQTSLQSSSPPSDLIPTDVLKFALERCQEFIRFRENDDLDQSEVTGSEQAARNNRKFNNNNNVNNTNAENHNNTSISWGEFLTWSSAFIRNEKDISPCATSDSECRKVLMMMRTLCPQYEMEGSRNVWILKPGAKSRGRGIRCFDTYNEITSTATSSDCQCVVQKYIERPLLIYKTKFDIRQWFLVTDWSPLTLWFYYDCYLRFCSREFTLDDFHVSVHLSNNSVQKHFAANPERSKNLPDDNMWTSEQFQEYLRRNGHGRVWSEYIVPEMKHAILCSLLCTQEFVEGRKGAFELYGADFMISEDMRVWLLEINSSPSMARNTKATSMLVDAVMEDMVKVVLDRKADKNCDTGRFELIYKQPLIPAPSNLHPNLTLHGRKIRKINMKK